jgi:AcrR family transcriptional regulator
MRAERMQRVLDEAAALFAQRDFHDVSMDEVASRAGVSKPVVYTHFESKDGLYEAVVMRAAAELSERIRIATESAGGAEERVWAGILALIEAVEEHRDWWLVARRASLADEPLRSSVRRANAQIAVLIEDLFEDAAVDAGIPGGSEDTQAPTAHAFVGACGATVDWWLDHPEVPRGTVALTLMNLIWMGLGDLIEANVWLPPELRE